MTSTDAKPHPTIPSWAHIYAGSRHRPPPTLAANTTVFHDNDEWASRTNKLARHLGPTFTTYIDGIRCNTRAPDQSELVAALCPPYNALQIKYRGCGNTVPDEAVNATHEYTPRERQEGEGGDIIVRQLYATCQGCYDAGYHLASTDIAPTAFGVDPTADPETNTSCEVAGGPPRDGEFGHINWRADLDWEYFIHGRMNRPREIYTVPDGIPVFHNYAEACALFNAPEENGEGHAMAIAAQRWAILRGQGVAVAIASLEYSDEISRAFIAGGHMGSTAGFPAVKTPEKATPSLDAQA